MGGSGHSTPTQISFPHHLVLRERKLSGKRFGIEAAHKISNFKYAGGDIWYNLIYKNINISSHFWLESLKNGHRAHQGPFSCTLNSWDVTSKVAGWNRS